MEEKECCCCNTKKTPRSEELVSNINNRINRIIGQLNGIKSMVDQNRYCGDVLTQIAAVESALSSLGYIILDEHMKTCVVDDIKDGKKETLDELLDLMKKLKWAL